MDTRNDELQSIIEEIENDVRQYARELGDVDIDNDYTWFEREFFEEVRRWVKYKQPGWKLLLIEYESEIY